MFKKLLPILVIAVLAIPAFALAQQWEKGWWWHCDRFAPQVQFTEEEKLALDEAHLKSLQIREELRNRLNTERAELDRLLSDANASKSAITAQHKKVSKAQDELAQERFNFLMTVREKVGTERFNQVQNGFRHYRKGWKDGSMRRGQGGPGAEPGRPGMMRPGMRPDMMGPGGPGGQGMGPGGQDIVPGWDD
jgi:Spy/CpxP family protein refolding chaperone